MIVGYVLFVLAIIGIIVTSFIILAKNIFNEYIVRINESETNIDSILHKRFDYLNKANDIIKEETSSEEDVLKTLVSIRSESLNKYDLDSKIYTIIEELYDYSDDDIDVKNNQDYINITTDIIDSESEILALKEYYNDIVKKYNILVEKFPYKLYAKMKKYTEKELFNIVDHSELINNLKER